MLFERSPFFRDIEGSTYTTQIKRNKRLVNGAPPDNPKPSSILGNVEHEFEIGDMLGSGKTGFVHAVTTMDGTALPLCVKIAFPSERAALSQEAWFYDDLQVVQGSVIPTCYGYFEETLPLDASLCHPEHCDRFPTRRDGQGVVPGRIGILLLERLSNEHLPLRHVFSQEEW